jgi:hypothetical protein
MSVNATRTQMLTLLATAIALDAWLLIHVWKTW